MAKSAETLNFVVFGSDGGEHPAFLEHIVDGSEPVTKAQQDSSLLGSEDDSIYRFFTTGKRDFAVTEVSGQGQSARFFSIGGPKPDIAIILIDVNRGVTARIRWSSLVTGLIGIQKVVLAVCNMDQVDYAQAKFESAVAGYAEFSAELIERGHTLFDTQAIPVSTRPGDNILQNSEKMFWYEGPSVLEYLEEVPFENDPIQHPLRLPVQKADQNNLSGWLASGQLSVGDAVKVMPSAAMATVEKLHFADGKTGLAVAGQSVTIVLDDRAEVSPGDMIVQGDKPPEVANQFETTIIWLSENALLPGRSYSLEAAGGEAHATITNAKYKIDTGSLEQHPAPTVEQDEIARCTISLDRQIPFDPYEENRETGGFTLVDRQTDEVVGVGVIHFALRRAANIHWQATDVSNAARARMKSQKPSVLWFTGLSGSGKSTIANILDQKLVTLGHHTVILDGDNVRHGLNRDLGFTDADRVENIRRVSEVAKLMAEAGLIVLVSFISPFRSERRLAREIMPDIAFIEVHVDTPLEVAEQRDVKGLYAKARAGEIANFTGIDSPYEAPENAEIKVDTVSCSAAEAADIILTELDGRALTTPAN